VLPQVAAALRAGVEAATRLTCSVGVAPNATLAKVASDLNKPNGQALVASSREAVMAFVHDLPIRKVTAAATLVRLFCPDCPSDCLVLSMARSWLSGSRAC
jgi:hypothetical protein